MNTKQPQLQLSTKLEMTWKWKGWICIQERLLFPPPPTTTYTKVKDWDHIWNKFKIWNWQIQTSVNQPIPLASTFSNFKRPSRTQYNQKANRRQKSQNGQGWGFKLKLHEEELWQLIPIILGQYRPDFP